jgi:phosphotransferase system IIB component
MSHDYSTIAREILENLGGSDNLEQAAHCVTRLRLALKDPSLVNSSALNQVDLVKGSFFTGGLFQVVIGPGEVEKVYAFIEQTLQLQIAYAQRTIEALPRGKDDQTHLDLEGQSHVIVVSNQTFLQDGRQFEYTESRHTLDKFYFSDIARR